MNKGLVDMLRKQLESGDFDSLSERERMILLLSYSEHSSIEEKADRLLETYGNIKSASDADPEFLAKNCNVSIQTAVLINLIPQIDRFCAINSKNILLDTYSRRKQFFASYYKGIRREKLVVAALNRRRRLIAAAEIAEGSSTDVSFSKRLIAEFAVKNNSDTIILSHVHPMSNCTPSPEDIRATESIVAAMKHIDITVLDHIIVGDDGDAVSLRETIGAKLFR